MIFPQSHAEDKAKLDLEEDQVYAHKHIIMTITFEIKNIIWKKSKLQAMLLQRSNLLQSAIKCLWEASLNVFEKKPETENATTMCLR